MRLSPQIFLPKTAISVFWHWWFCSPFKESKPKIRYERATR